MASAEAAIHNPSSYGPRMSRAVIDLGGGMMRDALSHKISPSSIVSSITGCRLNEQQLSIISNAQRRGDYNECDITLLYTLLRNCTATKIALKPTTGWGRSPAPSNVTLGDDLERIRLMRNKVYGHVATTSIPHSIYTQHMDELRGICLRMDTVHRDQLTKLSGTTWTYSQALNDIQICCMDADMESKYIDEIKKQERALESVNERLDELSTKCDENKEFTEKLASEVQKQADVTKEITEKLASDVKKQTDENKEFTEKLASEVQKQAAVTKEITKKLASDAKTRAGSSGNTVNIGNYVHVDNVKTLQIGSVNNMINNDGNEDGKNNCLSMISSNSFDKLLDDHKDE